MDSVVKVLATMEVKLSPKEKDDFIKYFFLNVCQQAEEPDSED